MFQFHALNHIILMINIINSKRELNIFAAGKYNNLKIIYHV